MRACASIVFMFTQMLNGRCDCTTTIARSPCLVEEAIFREVVSGKEAQRTLRGTHWCSRCWKKAVLLCLAPSRYILLKKLEWSPRTIKVIGLASDEGRKTGSLSDLESYKLTQDCKTYPSTCVHVFFQLRMFSPAMKTIITFWIICFVCILFCTLILSYNRWDGNPTLIFYWPLLYMHHVTIGAVLDLATYTTGQQQGKCFPRNTHGPSRTDVRVSADQRQYISIILFLTLLQTVTIPTLLEMEHIKFLATILQGLLFHAWFQHFFRHM